MFFHVIVTNQCNSECRYCFGEAMLDEDDNFEGLDVDYALPKGSLPSASPLDNRS